MKTGVLMAARFLFCGMDIYMLYRFFKTMFQRRLQSQKMILCFCCAVCIECVVNQFESTWINLIVMPFIYAIFVIIAFKISVNNGIVYTIIFYAIFAGGGAVFELLYRLLSEQLAFEISVWTVGYGIYFMLIDYIMRFLFLLYIERFTSKLEVEENRDFAWYLLVVPISSITILISYAYIDFPDAWFLQLLMFAGTLLIYFSNAVIFIILERYTAIMNQRKYDALYQVKQELDDEKFQNIARLNENYRCYMHDMHNYLNNIRLLAMQEENEAVVKIINDMEGEIQDKEIEYRLYSGNSVLNSILTEQYSRATEMGIAMTIFVEHFLGMEFILKADMISMFGNLLENAVAAAAQCKKEKKVDVKLFMGNQYMFVFYVENSYDEVRRGQGEFLSTKQEQGHGLGIGIVRRLAEKYGGTLTLEAQEEKFVTILTISAVRNVGGANFGI